MIDRFATALEVLALALWVGALAGFAFIVAPTAFAQIHDLDVFGALTAAILAKLGIAGALCGAVAILAAIVRLALERSGRVPAAVRVVLVAAMLVGIEAERRIVIPQMNAAARDLRAPYAGLAGDAGRRARFDALHHRSTQIYGSVLIAGFAALVLAATAGRGRRYAIVERSRAA